jgi:hypothetical protein
MIRRAALGTAASSSKRRIASGEFFFQAISFATSFCRKVLQPQSWRGAFVEPCR